MSVVRWEHLTQNSPVLRFGAWLWTSLGQVPYPGVCGRSLGYEYSLLELETPSH